VLSLEFHFRIEVDVRSTRLACNITQASLDRSEVIRSDLIIIVR
jgi:hypothetical protein